MDERVVQFRVGVVMLATAIMVAILIAVFGESPDLLRAQYSLRIRLPRAPGISVDSPVRRNGITIGRVQALTFTADGKVEVAAAIDENVQLGRNEQCRVRGSLLGGDTALDFTTTGDSALAAQYYQDGDLIEGKAPVDPLDIVAKLGDNLDALPEAIVSVRKAGNQVGELAARINSLLPVNDEQIDDFLSTSKETMDSIGRAADALNSILGDPQVQADLRQGVSELPQLLADTRTTVDKIQQMVRVADRTFRNLDELTGPFSQRAETMATKIDDSLSNLDELLSFIKQFAQQANRQDSTLGQLLHSRDLYDNLNRTVINVEQLSRELRPILRDARVFTDKIARDPGRLGVRGVLRKPGGLK